MPSPAVARHRTSGFPTLAGDRVWLRRPVAGDAAAIREISVYDGQWAQSEAEALSILAKIERDCERGESFHWCICEVGSAEVVGTCGFYRGFPENVGEIGYILRESFRGRGLMTAALELVVSFGINELKLAGIVAYTAADNRASVKVLERLGFRSVPRDEGNLEFVL